VGHPVLAARGNILTAVSEHAWLSVVLGARLLNLLQLLKRTCSNLIDPEQAPLSVSLDYEYLISSGE